MSLESVAQATAAKSYFKELATARSLGYPPIDALTSAFRCMDSVYLSAFKPECPAVWPRTDIVVTGKGPEHFRETACTPLNSTAIGE